MSSRRQAAADDDEARTKRISGIRRSWFPDEKKGLAMTEPRTCPSPPVELPIDPWLLEGTRAAHCKVCTALAREREEALAYGDRSKAYEVSREIRNHRHVSIP
ncbi:predicted protein [Streptomyces albidoflavus]|nr:predicted protein [Streptomyces albidoflavus]BDH52925.1 hypothetical protein MTP02_39360 [Streptomyces albus]